MADKAFKTHDDLINILESRGIIFNSSYDRGQAKKYLQRIGYYTLINGYSSLFQSEKDKYKEGTIIKEIVALYVFDQKLREILLQRILPIEVNIKSLVAYYFPQHHAETNYLNYTNFDILRKDASKNITALISEIQRQIASRVTDPSISHYLKEYGYVPLWVLNNILTLGTISKFYSLMKQDERQEIAKVFKMQDSVLESALTYISSVRNFCAHGNRLYCYRSKRPLCNTDLHKQMNILKSKTNEYVNGKRDLFAVLIIFKLMLSQNDFEGCVNQIEAAINRLYTKIYVIDKAVILSSLGFPENWKDLIINADAPAVTTTEEY